MLAYDKKILGGGPRLPDGLSGVEAPWNEPGVNFFKVNNRNTRTIGENCPELFQSQQ